MHWKRVPMSYEQKICKKCSIEKDIEYFSKYKAKKTGKVYYRTTCKDCRKPHLKNSNIEQYNKNKELRKQQSKKYYNNNKNTIKSRRATYLKEYAIKNKKKLNEKAQKWQAAKRQDICYRLRSNIGRSIRSILFENNGGKAGKSLLLYMDYSLEELKHHLESQFDVWMNWNNYGTYRVKTWNDSDSTTWIWNIDHIIPQSKLIYDNMEHPNFKKCWSLKNLRPCSAKVNLLLGNRK